MSPVTDPVRRWWWWVVVAACSLPGSAGAAPAAERKQVLVVYAARRDAQISIIGDRELPNILEEGFHEGFSYYSEYVDRVRFPDPSYQAAMADFLRRKYRRQRFDLVIAVQDIAIQFVDANREELFPDTPVVFLARDPSIRRPANSTGVISEPKLTGTIALAGELEPDVRRVFFVSGAGAADKGYERRARAQFRSFEPRLASTYLSGLTTTELEARLSKLPGHSIVYFLLVSQDGAGVNLHPLEYVDRVTAIANRPTYSWVDSAMDHGIVGGSLLDQTAEMKTIGTLALRVLRGELADGIPISAPELSVSQVDWRQLQRWHIDETRIPSGTLVRFRTPSAWERHRVSIVAAIAVLLAQTSLIAGLVVQAARRGQAEKRARRSQAEVRTSYERIRDLGRRLLEAQDAERSRVARELHDDISQQVALLTIDLDLLRGLGREESEESGRLVREGLDRLASIERSVDELSHRLHPDEMSEIGLVAAVDRLAGRLSLSGFAVRFTHQNVPIVFPHEPALCLFRIVQEAVQNALKYSGARTVAVHLQGNRDGLVLTVTDDGRGFDVPAMWGRGLGLISMAERLDAIGGTLTIRSTPGEGTRLEATVTGQAGSSSEFTRG